VSPVDFSSIGGEQVAPAPAGPPPGIDFSSIGGEKVADAQPVAAPNPNPRQGERDAYKAATKAGPFTKPGAAEAVTDVTSDDALNNMKIGAEATLAVPAAAGTAANLMSRALLGKSAVAAMEEAAPSLSTLLKIAKQTEAEAEVAGAETAAKGWAKFSEVAARGAAEAEDMKTAAAYKAASLLAKGNSAWEASWAWVGRNLPGAPLAIKSYAAYEVVKYGYDKVTSDDHKDKDEK
jgi:hypothetical protein